MNTIVDFWRRFSILNRLNIGFLLALLPLIVGMAWVTLGLGSLEALLQRGEAGNTDTEMAALATRVGDIRTAIWWSLSIAALTGFALIVAVTLSIVRPLGALGRSTTAIAGGDLTQVLDLRWHDEVGRMAATLDGMKRQLAGVVGEILRGAGSVSQSSEELASSNLDLSQRTETSASHLQQTAAAMEQIQSMSQQSAASALRVVSLTEQAAATAAKGGAAIADGVATMTALTASSRKMADIISVIDGIAFQTNILALNAAVEAARAGEAGRGFNVVATEVRGLATRSAASARQIKELIQSAIDEAECGARAVTQAGATMDLVIASVKDMNACIDEINGAAAEQCTGIASVTRSVAELDGVTQRNAASVEEAAAAAAELQSQAQGLFRAVSVFRIAA
jgi:methyl-accepting chemotaxis protein